MLDPTAATRLDRQLRELPEILAHAYLALLPGAGARGARVTGATRSAPLPCNLAVLDALTPGPTEDIPGIDLLISWARVVLDDRRAANDWSAWTPMPQLHREAPASVAIKHLQFHARFAVTRYYAPDLAREIDALHHHLDRLARHPIRSARPVRTPCPACTLLSLCERTDGVRECVACRAEFSPAEYESATEQTLRELNAA